MRPEEDRAILRDIDRRILKNRISEWKRQAKKHPVLAFLQLFMAVFVVVMWFAIYLLYILMSEEGFEGPSPAVAYGIGTALLLLFGLVMVAAGAGIMTSVSNAQTDLILPSPLRRSSFVLGRYRYAWAILVGAVTGLMLLIFGPSFTSRGAGELVPFARLTGGVLAFTIGSLNATLLALDRVARLPARKRDYLGRAVFAVLLVFIFSVLGYLSYLLLQFNGELLVARLQAMFDHPVLRGLLVYVFACLDVMYAGAPGPLLAVEATCVGLFAAVTTYAVLRTDFQVFEEKGLGTGREIDQRPLVKSGPLSKIRLQWPETGNGHRAIIALNLVKGFRRGGAAMPLVLIMTFGVMGLIMEGFPVDMVYLFLPFILVMIGSMTLFFSQSAWWKLDVLLPLPVDRSGLVLASIAPSLFYQLAGWYGFAALVTVLGPLPSVLSVIGLFVLPPFVFFYLDSVMVFDIINSRDLDALTPYPTPQVQPRPHKTTLLFSVPLVLIVSLVIIGGLAYLSSLGFDVLSIALLSIPILALLGAFWLWAAGRKLDGIARRRTPRWMAAGSWVAAVVSIFLCFAGLIPAVEYSTQTPERPGSILMPEHFGTTITGSWILNDNVITVNNTLWIRGRDESDLVMLFNMTLLVNCSTEGVNGIYVTTDLWAKNCTFRPLRDGDFMVFRANHDFEAVNCTFLSPWGNITRRDGGGGLELRGNSRLTNCTVSGGKTNGVYCSDGLTIERCRIFNNSDDGIESRGATVSIIDSNIHDNGRGVNALGGGYSALFIDDTTIRFNRGDGIFATSLYGHIGDSDISDNGGWGIRTAGVSPSEIGPNIVINNGAGARTHERIRTEPGFELPAIAVAFATALFVVRNKRSSAKKRLPTA